MLFICPGMRRATKYRIWFKSEPWNIIALLFFAASTPLPLVFRALAPRPGPDYWMNQARTINNSVRDLVNDITTVNISPNQNWIKPGRDFFSPQLLY